jgi:exo-beta-1,3-glucanase (GH17 family)
MRPALLFALVASAIVLFWYTLGRLVPLPPSPLGDGDKLSCLSYTPFHGGLGPYAVPLRIPDERIAGDLERLAKVTRCIRTYSAAGFQGTVTRLAGEYGLKVLQGIWISRDRADNRREIEAALGLARHHPGVIQAFIVGNEVLLRGEQSAEQIKTYLDEVRRRSGLPVTYADVWEFWLKAPELAPAVDFVTIHILPYWEDEPVAAEDAVAHIGDIHNKVAAAFPGKEIFIGEVGWPSAGRMRDGALPSPANQALVLSGVVEAAKEGGWKINLIEAFDQPWKRLLEGTVGGYWGIYDDANRELKFHWGVPVSNHSQWRLEAGLGVGAALLVFLGAFAFGGTSRGEGIGWTKSLAIAAIALVSGLAFGAALLGIPMEPPYLGDRLRSSGMVVLSLLAPIAAAIAVARSSRLDGFAWPLNASLRQLSDRWSLLLALLFVATIVAAIHVALGLVFDPRYKDFQLALLSGPVTAFAVVALWSRAPRPEPDAAEITAAALLTGSALYVVFDEGLLNWQALWLAGLLLVLAVTALSARRAPG